MRLTLPPWPTMYSILPSAPPKATFVVGILTVPRCKRCDTRGRESMDSNDYGARRRNRFRYGYPQSGSAGVVSLELRRRRSLAPRRYGVQGDGGRGTSPVIGGSPAAT